MGKGFLLVELTTDDEAMPVVHADVEITDNNGKVLYILQTDMSGHTTTVELPAPDKIHSLHPEPEVPYSTYKIRISAKGYYSINISNVKILDTSTTIQPVDMIALPQGDETRNYTPIEINQGVHNLVRSQPRFVLPDIPTPRVLRDVIIPTHINVHLGRPNVPAGRARVTFKEYIKNVASNEIYDTWPTAALTANIYCIISFTLNRIYTEFYRNQGYSFDITNSTSIDQTFVNGSAFGKNISDIVDQIFNKYLAQVNHKEPFVSHYCDGNQVKCPGWLSQWGSCTDALNGMTYAQIIRKYYAGRNIEFRESNLISSNTTSYPGSALRQGMSGENVRTIQMQLNRIRRNFPAIPAINPVDGYFGPSTTAAVIKFQEIFNLTPDGIVGPATWYKISQIYTAVTKLSESDSEGEPLNPGEGGGQRPNPPYPGYLLRVGSSGDAVRTVQTALVALSQKYPQIPKIAIDGQFGPATQAAVIAFQRLFGLSADGIVGPATWERLMSEYTKYTGRYLTEVPPYAKDEYDCGCGDNNPILEDENEHEYDDNYSNIEDDYNVVEGGKNMYDYKNLILLALVAKLFSGDGIGLHRRHRRHKRHGCCCKH